jgi:predicted DNA-binding transcriptional regulator YafY
MPVNKNALIRYKTIDKCLQNHYRKWTLENLIENVSQAIYEYEGIKKPISKRTIQADIQMMRSDKLGYNAPIVVANKRHYEYEDKNYSITNIPLSEQDLSRMTEAVDVLKQFKGFSHFTKLNEVVKKLEDHIYSASSNENSVIDFEKNNLLKGIEHLDIIYEAIINKKAVLVNYQSFKAREVGSFLFHAWWLKQFKNRWFMIGQRGNQQEIITLALDRIVSIAISKEKCIANTESLTPEEYYNDVIGVTVSKTIRATPVRIQVNQQHAPYVETKPLHHSQKTLEQNKEGIIIEIKVQHNYELEREILGFGEGMIVLSPAKLRNILKRRVEKMMGIYAD